MQEEQVASCLESGNSNGGNFPPLTYWLDRSEVPESSLWEAVRERRSSAPFDLQIELLLSEARTVSGMDSIFLVRDGAITYCVNGGPLKLAKGQTLAWFPTVREELVAGGTRQTCSLDRERADALPGFPPRVKTLFVLPIRRPRGIASSMLCGISQMRVVMDSGQLSALNLLSVRLAPLIRRQAAGMGMAEGRIPSTAGASSKARKAVRRPAFAHVFGGRDAVTRVIGAT